jgi:hypothetical protein
MLYNSDVEADVALSRCAPSGPRSLTPVVMPTHHRQRARFVGGRAGKFDVACSPRAVR